MGVAGTKPRHGQGRFPPKPQGDPSPAFSAFRRCHILARAPPSPPLPASSMGSARLSASLS